MPRLFVLVPCVDLSAFKMLACLAVFNLSSLGSEAVVVRKCKIKVSSAKYLPLAVCDMHTNVISNTFCFQERLQNTSSCEFARENQTLFFIIIEHEKPVL